MVWLAEIPSGCSSAITPKKADITTIPGQNEPFVLVGIPAYNEEIAIGSVILRSLKYADMVLVIDDFSQDSTAEVAEMAGACVISHKANMGKGTGIKEIFQHAKKVNADIVVLIDGDGQHDPDEIPLLLKPILDGEADMVVGSRYLAGSTHKASGYRRIGQQILNFVTNLTSRNRVTDTQSGFRSFAKTTFDRFSFKQAGMGIESEMLIDAAFSGLRVKEVAVDIRYDVEGSTYNPVVHGFSVLASILNILYERRPLTFFSVPGFILLFIGLSFNFLTLKNYANCTIVGYATFSLLFIILGSLCLFIGLSILSLQSIEVKKLKL